MDLAEPNSNHHHIEDVYHQQSTSSNCSDICDVFGDPEELPRLGENYQAEIPPLMTGFDALWPTSKKQNVPYNFLTGLDIPLMWVSEESDNTCKSNLRDTSDKTKPMRCENNGEGLIFMKNEGLESPVQQQGVMNEKCDKYKGKRCSLVPGSLGEKWSETDEASFVLGLYIFGKNLVEVKKFIGNRTMGSILSFYYGRFYRSNEYRRWSECRKSKGRRHVFGHRIFTGLRQQELLSRLCPHLSMDCQKALMEVSKTFGEGKILLAKYVATLKSLVGMSDFIEAVAIGKGKQDLTGISWGESLKSNAVVAGHVDPLISKACSSLTHEEIVKLLTGDIRLSKARSRDIFWEAVWPRLLARGWNSEQPKNQFYGAGPTPLVFLVPGVAKFSRRKLVKGTHYFDSITDVLGKVSSDPGLLVLEIEAGEMDNKTSKEASGSVDVATVAGENEFSNPSRHCYLQPRTLNHHDSDLEFTVVDTSISTGVRELRHLPSLNNLESRYHSEENAVMSDSSDNLSYKDQTDSKRADNGGASSSNGAISFSVNSLDSAVDLSVESCKKQKTNLPDNGQIPRKKAAKLQKRKPHCLGPATKRPRLLAACNCRADLSFSERSCLCSSNPDSGATVGPFQEPPPQTTMFDLNLPQTPLEFDVHKDGLTEKQLEDDASGFKASMDAANGSHQPDMNPQRRQSMRSRPLTTRALEALESGFLSPKRSRKSTDEISDSSRASSRHPRVGV